MEDSTLRSPITYMIYPIEKDTQTLHTGQSKKRKATWSSLGNAHAQKSMHIQPITFT